jgi:hypothetical protein
MRNMSQGFGACVRGLFSIYDSYTGVINYYYRRIVEMIRGGRGLKSKPHPKKLRVHIHT